MMNSQRVWDAGTRSKVAVYPDSVFQVIECLVRADCGVRILRIWLWRKLREAGGRVRKEILKLIGNHLKLQEVINVSSSTEGTYWENLRQRPRGAGQDAEAFELRFSRNFESYTRRFRELVRVWVAATERLQEKAGELP